MVTKYSYNHKVLLKKTKIGFVASELFFLYLLRRCRRCLDGVFNSIDNV